MSVLIRLLSVSPLWLVHGLGWGLGWLVFFCSAGYRRNFVHNVRQAGQTWVHGCRAVGEAGKLVMELPRLWLGPPVRLQWSGRECLDHALAQGQGVVFLTPHLGCFEIAAQAYVQVYGHQHAPMTVLFRPPKKTWLREWVTLARTRQGLRTVPTNLAGVRQLLRALKGGECVGLLPDQVPPKGQGVWAPFFDQPAYTMTLSVRLAQQSGATVLLAWGERLSWGRGYRVHVQPLPEALPADLTQAVTLINRAMESLIRKCPQQYLWAYARYKDPREG